MPQGFPNTGPLYCTLIYPNPNRSVMIYGLHTVAYGNGDMWVSVCVCVYVCVPQ